jgi:uncharacterized membrane protein (UPF0127 family)
MEFLFYFRGKEKKIEVRKVPRFFEGIGLMFSSKKRAKILLFDLRKPVNLKIHSFFVFFPFVAIWLDEDKNLIEIKKILPFRILIKARKNFKYLIEIPLNGFYDDVLKSLVGKESFK